MASKNTENCSRDKVSPEGPVETSNTLKTPTEALASSAIQEDTYPAYRIIQGSATSPLSVSPSSSILQCSQQPPSCSSHPDPQGQAVALGNKLIGDQAEQIEEASGGCEILQQQEENGPNTQSLLKQTVKSKSESTVSTLRKMGEERFFYGAYIGSEARSMEFKRGEGNYLHDVFKEDLRKYVCAFLNSGGGTLLVGVDNDGIVQGINCSQKQQDHLQLLVDSILKRFHPPLLPHSYSLTFVPVVKAGPDSKNLKVLRLSVRPPSSQCKFVLYKTDQGAVFIRMDGSVEDRLIQQREKKSWIKYAVQHVMQTLKQEFHLTGPVTQVPVLTQTAPECATILAPPTPERKGDDDEVEVEDQMTKPC